MAHYREQPPGLQYGFRRFVHMFNATIVLEYVSEKASCAVVAHFAVGVFIGKGSSYQKLTQRKTLIRKGCLIEGGCEVESLRYT